MDWGSQRTELTCLFLSIEEQHFCVCISFPSEILKLVNILFMSVENQGMEQFIRYLAYDVKAVSWFFAPHITSCRNTLCEALHWSALTPYKEEQTEGGDVEWLLACSSAGGQRQGLGTDPGNPASHLCITLLRVPPLLWAIASLAKVACFTVFEFSARSPV